MRPGEEGWDRVRRSAIWLYRTGIWMRGDRKFGVDSVFETHVTCTSCAIRTTVTFRVRVAIGGRMIVPSALPRKYGGQPLTWLREAKVCPFAMVKARP